MFGDLTEEVSDEIKKWDCCAGGAAEAIVALTIDMGARRVNPEQFLCNLFYTLIQEVAIIKVKIWKKSSLGAAPQLALVLSTIHPLSTACNEKFASYWPFVRLQWWFSSCFLWKQTSSPKRWTNLRMWFHHMWRGRHKTVQLQVQRTLSRLTELLL